MANTMNTTALPKNRESGKLELANTFAELCAYDIRTHEIAETPGIDALAARIARQRAKIQFLGATRCNGKEFSYQAARLTGGEIVVRRAKKSTVGTGIPVEKVMEEELTLAARASLISSYQVGIVGLTAYKLASKAARSLFHSSTREQIFDSLELAEKAHNRAIREVRSVEKWQYELDPSGLSRAVFNLKRLRIALRKHWEEKRASGFRKASWCLREDLKLSRAAVLSSYRGGWTFPQKSKDRNAWEKMESWKLRCAAVMERHFPVKKEQKEVLPPVPLPPKVGKVETISLGKRLATREELASLAIKTAR